MNMATTAVADLKAIKARQQVAWSSGDYALIGTTLQIVGEQLCEALDLRSGSKVLDVAAGNGNVSPAAARRFCAVPSTHYVPAFSGRGRGPPAEDCASTSARRTPRRCRSPMRASTPWVDLRVIFARLERAAAEMLRVCKRGGKIGLANWTPEGFIGQMFKVVGKHVAPPAGMKSPLLWGSPERLGELFDSRKGSVISSKREFNFRYNSPAHFVEVFRTWYGPVHKAFGALNEAGQAFERPAHADRSLQPLEGRNDGDASEYLEIVVRRG